MFSVPRTVSRQPGDQHAAARPHLCNAMLGPPRLVEQRNRQRDRPEDRSRKEESRRLNHVGPPAVKPWQRIGRTAHRSAPTGCRRSASSRLRASPTRYTDPEITITPPAAPALRDFQRLAHRSRCLRRRSRSLGRRQQVAHRRGSRAGDGRKNHPLEQRKQNLRHLRRGLVAQATENQRPRSRFVQNLPQPRPQRPRARRIVRHIQNALRALAGHGIAHRNPLQPPRPPRLVNPLRNRRRRNRNPVALRQFHRRGHRQRHIAMLVRSAQRRSHLDRRPHRLHQVRSRRIRAHRRHVHRRHVRHGAHPAHRPAPSPLRPAPGSPQDAAAT